MTDAQRQYYLRQQLKAIQEELGEKEGAEIGDLRERIEKAKLPEHVAAVAEREVDRLERMTPASPEYQMIRTYLDWVLDVPVDDDHRGPPRPGRGAAGARRGPLRPRQGQGAHRRVPGRPQAEGRHEGARSSASSAPPGVGKTSLGQSIARAMNRKFVRISLGGVRDEAEIRGHRRTYIGALPGPHHPGAEAGRLGEPGLHARRDRQDERRLPGRPGGGAARGARPGAEQHVPRPLPRGRTSTSRACCSSRRRTSSAPVHPALLDRMEVISLAGYTEEEKLHIARRYLIPRQLAEHGLAGRRARSRRTRRCGE